jgi:hypothetical protein
MISSSRFDCAWRATVSSSVALASDNRSAAHSLAAAAERASAVRTRSIAAASSAMPPPACNKQRVVHEFTPSHSSQLMRGHHHPSQQTLLPAV